MSVWVKCNPPPLLMYFTTRLTRTDTEYAQDPKGLCGCVHDPAVREKYRRRGGENARGQWALFAAAQGAWEPNMAYCTLQ